MKKRDFHGFFIALVASILCAYGYSAAFAGNSWFDKGSELLKSFGGGDTTKELTLKEIGEGLKEALRVGSGNVVNRLSLTDGFNKDPDIHIPLPQSLDTVKKMLAAVGMSALFEDLELKLNRAAEMKPVIDESLSQVGAVKAYDTMIKQYKTLPFVPDVKANLTGHVIEKGMDGIFYYMAKEEAAIRQDPARRTTALLKKVFEK